MDVEALQKKGLEPVKPTLDRIAALTDSKGIATLVGQLAAAGEPVGLFALDVESDPTDSEKPILSLSPRGALLLPGHPRRMFMQAGDTILEALQPISFAAASNRKVHRLLDLRYSIGLLASRSAAVAVAMDAEPMLVDRCELRPACRTFYCRIAHSPLLAWWFGANGALVRQIQAAYW
jgi:hypothetical protein